MQDDKATRGRLGKCSIYWEYRSPEPLKICRAKHALSPKPSIEFRISGLSQLGLLQTTGVVYSSSYKHKRQYDITINLTP